MDNTNNFREIQNGDTVFATGVFLTRDTSVNGGWVVAGFEDDIYFDGEVVYDYKNDNKIIYYIGEELLPCVLIDGSSSPRI